MINSSKKLLNPNAPEWTPKQTPPPQPSSYFIPVVVVFGPPTQYYSAAEPVKPASGGGVTLVDITDFDPKVENKPVQKMMRTTVVERKKTHLVKRPKWPRKVDTGTRFPPRMQQRVGRSFHHLVELRPRKTASRNPRGNTTVMIKNIPNCLRRDFMIKFMDAYCKEYSLEYDFLYLPMDFRTGDNLGYAFVNFTNVACASSFKRVLQGLKWTSVCGDDGPMTSKKICHITWARIQGTQALLDWFKCTCFNCDKLDYLPVLLDPPRNGSDPNPPPPVVIGRARRCPN